MNQLDWLKKQPSKILKRQKKSLPEPSYACHPRPPARWAPADGLLGRTNCLGGAVAWRGLAELLELVAWELVSDY